MSSGKAINPYQRVYEKIHLHTYKKTSRKILCMAQKQKHLCFLGCQREIRWKSAKSCKKKNLQLFRCIQQCLVPWMFEPTVCRTKVCVSQWGGEMLLDRAISIFAFSYLDPLRKRYGCRWIHLLYRISFSHSPFFRNFYTASHKTSFKWISGHRVMMGFLCTVKHSHYNWI